MGGGSVAANSGLAAPPSMLRMSNWVHRATLVAVGRGALPKAAERGAARRGVPYLYEADCEKTHSVLVDDVGNDHQLAGLRAEVHDSHTANLGHT